MWVSSGFLHLVVGVCLLFSFSAQANSITFTDLQTIANQQSKRVDARPLPTDPLEVRRLYSRLKAYADRQLKKIFQYSPEETDFENTVVAVDSIMHEINKVESVLGHLCSIKKNSAIGKEARKQLRKLTEYSNALFLNHELFKRVKSLKGHAGLNSDQKQLVEFTLIEFTSTSKRPSIVVRSWESAGLYAEIVKQEARFLENIEVNSKLQFTPSELAGADQWALDKLPFDGTHYTLDTSEWWQHDHFLAYCTDSETRRKIWERAYAGAVPENHDLVNQLAAARKRIAELEGHPSWAAYTTLESSISAASVMRSFSAMEKGSRAAFAKEKREMRQILGRAVQPWDHSYIYRLKLETFPIDLEKSKEYFSFNTVLQGAIRTAESVYSLEIREILGKPSWGPDNQSFAVFDAQSGELLGTFDVDPYPRDEKVSWFAANPLQSSHLGTDGIRDLPHGVLLGNFNGPANGLPSLLSHEETWTVFHELGHLLHYALNTQPYASFFPGGRNEDLIEFPSSVLERFAWDPDVLYSIAGHYQTGEKPPKEWMDSLTQVRKIFPAHSLRRQLATSVIDLKIHSARVPAFQGLEEAVFKKYYYPRPKGIYITPSFGHFVDYGALYWGYLWSEALAEHQFKRFKRLPDGSWDPSEGLRLRKVFMETGVRYRSDDLIRKTMGGKFSFCSTLLTRIGN